MLNHEKQMVKLFESMRYRHEIYNVFSDFLEMSALAISNSVDLFYYSKREKRYMEIVKRYNKEELEAFPKLLGHLVAALDEEMKDVLGNIFMELELSNSHRGQFFTPMSVSHAMAQLTLGDVGELIKEKGFFTVNEPAVGGGVTIIAVAKVLQEKKYNYQKVMKVVAQDIDIKSVHMAYVQFSLLGIDAVVLRGDTLAYKFDKDVWRTPNNVLQWARVTGKPKEEIGEPQHEQMVLF